MRQDATDLLVDIEAIVQLALAEDVGSGDLTADLIPEASHATATVVSREQCVLCGTPWFDRVFARLSPDIQITWHFKDGDDIPVNSVLCDLAGPARPLVTGERTALNFLQTLSGTATLTRRFARVLEGTATRLLDTRKTLPGLRRAQKYAVQVGGGHNHRVGLFDAILIKENHIAAAGGITAAITQCHQRHPGVPVECEVETLAEAQEAATAGADMLLLDNFSLELMTQARRNVPKHIELEASGNVDINRLRAIASTGVNYVSVGTLTKHVKAIDLSMRIA
ncbi:MAG: carboxylating nicotinate-nucleotide diphosphorylase [Gammaproteobacteria bacterium]|nr:carboxylating nicotinate-nucleotide diphosphorylase [Gammaproteobacteria bacterium]